MKPILIILTAFVLIHLGSCTTPLDLNTPRIDSLLTPSFRLRTLSTMVLHGDSTADTVAIDNWKCVQDTLYFHTSHNEYPPRLTLYARLVRDSTADTTSALLLQSLEITLANVPTNDTTHMNLNPGNRLVSGVSADASFRDQSKTYRTNVFARNFQGVADLKFVDGIEKRIEGTITVVVRANDSTRITIITTLEGEQ